MKEKFRNILTKNLNFQIDIQINDILFYFSPGSILLTKEFINIIQKLSLKNFRLRKNFSNREYRFLQPSTDGWRT